MGQGEKVQGYKGEINLERQGLESGRAENLSFGMVRVAFSMEGLGSEGSKLVELEKQKFAGISRCEWGSLCGRDE